MVKRNLDGVYFRVQTEDGKWDNVCFSDLTELQQTEVMKNKDEVWLRSLCKILAKTIRNIGDQFDIISVHDEDNGNEI